MTELFPPSAVMLAFMGASLLLTLTPGPAVVYVLARTLSQGRASGLASVLGVALGNLGNGIAAALGLAAVFAVSAVAFSFVKWAGALYLLWIGIQMWRRAGDGVDAQTIKAPAATLGKVFRDGFVVALLNPKTTLFFAAFLPQFVVSPSHALAQSLMLAACFTLLALITDVLYVLAAHRLAGRWRSSRASLLWGRRLAASSFIGLGLLTAAARRPGA